MGEGARYHATQTKNGKQNLGPVTNSEQASLAEARRSSFLPQTLRQGPVVFLTLELRKLYEQNVAFTSVDSATVLALE